MIVVAKGVLRYARRCGGVSVLTLLLIEAVAVGPARAEDDAAETAAARSLAVDGLKLADAGKCADAIDKLSRAEKLHHAPIVLGRLGECQITQGKIVDGTENLRKVLREALPANPSPALVKARERAQAALDAAKPKIAVLTIVVKGPSNNTATAVTVDGQSVSSALLDTERPSDPGEHVIEASAPGFLKGSSRVILGAGDKQSVTLRLELDPNYVAPSAPGDTSNLSLRPGASPESGGMAASRDASPSGGSGAPSGPPNRSGAYISWAFGGAALAVGAGFGIIAIKGKTDLESKCLQNQCTSNLQGQLDNAKTAGTISTISFGVGAAGLILGTVLYFTAGPSSTERSAHAREPRVVPRAWVGLNAIGVAADF
jgi:hypothetical protein